MEANWPERWYCRSLVRKFVQWRQVAWFRATRPMLWVIGSLLPVLLLYNAYQYRVFRGKIISNGEADPS